MRSCWSKRRNDESNAEEGRSRGTEGGDSGDEEGGFRMTTPPRCGMMKAGGVLMPPAKEAASQLQSPCESAEVTDLLP